MHRVLSHEKRLVFLPDLIHWSEWRHAPAFTDKRIKRETVEEGQRLRAPESSSRALPRGVRWRQRGVKRRQWADGFTARDGQRHERVSVSQSAGGRDGQGE